MIFSLSPVSLAICATLTSLHLPIDKNGLISLLELPEAEIAASLNELSQFHIVEHREDGTLSLTGKLSREKLTQYILESEFAFPRMTLGYTLFAWYHGQFHDFLHVAVDRLVKLSVRGDVVKARLLYCVSASLMLDMPVNTSNIGEATEFLSKTIRMQKLMQLFPWRVDIAPKLYAKMLTVAEQCGDKRSLCWVKLAQGVLNINMSDALRVSENHAAMREGLQLVNELGDSNIIIQTSGMVCLYHFIEGEFTKAINCANSNLYQEDIVDIDFERLLFSYAGLSAISLGEYEVAVSMLNRAISRAQARKTPMNVDGLRGILAYAYLMWNEDERAFEIIDDLLGMNASAVFTYSSYTSVKILSYNHYRHGRLQQAYRVMRNWLPKDGRLGLIHSNSLIMPFMLEMLAAFSAAGLPPLYDIPLQQEIDNALTSPSKTHQAAAWRARAIIAAHEFGQNAPEVLEYLEQSLSILKGLYAPMDMCRTLEALCRFHLTCGREDLAREAASTAWHQISGSKEYLWPADLRGLVSPGKRAHTVSATTPASILVGAMQAMQQQYTWETHAEFFNSVLCSMLSALNLPRGALLRCGSPLTSLASVDMGTDYFRDERRTLQASLFEKSRDSRSSLWRRLHEDESSGRAAIALYVKTDGLGEYILYMEGIVRNAIMPLFGQELFTLMENFCITQITMFLKSVEVWQAQTAATPLPIKSDEHTSVFHAREMVELVERVDRLARKDTTVLILGESGVGKEVIARRLHELSGRSGKFVAVNIASTPEDLFESEFYGHEKGSFTGANYQKRGLFELADKGTLFIDEVGDIPPFLQVKLLRVLQEHKFMRVGGTRTMHSDFRLIAATNRNLEDAVRKGTFREDLYYRLSVVPVRIPALRDRPDDILPLARAFLLNCSQRDPSRVRNFTDAMEQAMLRYSWPGNVRELKNFVERYSIMPEQTSLHGISVVQENPAPISNGPSLFDEHLSLTELQDRYFEHLYTELNGTVGGKTGIAATLGISRTTAYAWIERLQLKEKYEKKLHRR